MYVVNLTIVEREGKKPFSVGYFALGEYYEHDTYFRLEEAIAWCSYLNGGEHPNDRYRSWQST